MKDSDKLIGAGIGAGIIGAGLYLANKYLGKKEKPIPQTPGTILEGLTSDQIRDLEAAKEILNLANTTTDSAKAIADNVSTANDVKKEALTALEAKAIAESESTKMDIDRLTNEINAIQQDTAFHQPQYDKLVQAANAIKAKADTASTKSTAAFNAMAPVQNAYDNLIAQQAKYNYIADQYTKQLSKFASFRTGWIYYQNQQTEFAFHLDALVMQTRLIKAQNLADNYGQQAVSKYTELANLKNIATNLQNEATTLRNQYESATQTAETYYQKEITPNNTALAAKISARTTIEIAYSTIMKNIATIKAQIALLG